MKRKDSNSWLLMLIACVLFGCSTLIIINPGWIKELVQIEVLMIIMYVSLFFLFIYAIVQVVNEKGFGEFIKWFIIRIALYVIPTTFLVAVLLKNI